MRLPFIQLDVFAPRRFSGNPLAVVFDADALDAEAMQRAAAWLGLSETTFVLRPSQAAADYRVRIFTPGAELPFAGHPTLGSCAAWQLRGGRERHAGRIVQESALGLVELRHDGARLEFAAPALRRSDVEPQLLAQVGAALGLRDAPRAASWLDNGPRWLALWLDDAASVLALRPDHAALRALGVKVGVAAPQPDTADTAIEVRAFAAAVGVDEDPVTGSLQASLAQWLFARGAFGDASRYVAAQGACRGRAGRVHARRDASAQVWIGGDVRAVVHGEIEI